MPHKVFFITGASKGLGRIWAEDALRRGDKVAAAARNTAPLGKLAARYGDNILPMRVDVNDPAAVDAAEARTRERFGRLDIRLDNPQLTRSHA
jgi:NAD(P)-dependent dehydrogenase (short-subunit alcohol dehydrogenase family)